MIQQRSRVVLFAIPLVVVAAFTIAADRSHPSEGVIDPTCTSSSPCIEYDNNGSGPGVRGIGLTGNGLSGEAKVNSSSASNGRAGVIGADSSSSGVFNAGVKGTSIRGTGVIGVSTSSNGVSGTSSSATGVSGASSTSFGVAGRTNGKGPVVAAVQGTNNASAIAVRANGLGGPLFVGNNSGGVDVFKVDDFGDVLATAEVVGGNSATENTGVEGQGTFEGVVGIAESSGGVGVRSTGVGGSLMYQATNSGDVNVFDVDDSGNVTITGLITTAGFCSSGCSVRADQPGARVVSYSPREAEPTIEDVGEAQLVSGRAYVRIDAALAGVMAQHSNYLVFITPEGDSRGLFVTGKSPAGFTVVENQGGHSTLAFSYRIVAKPFGVSGPRLAKVMMRAESRKLPSIARPAPLRVPKTQS